MNSSMFCNRFNERVLHVGPVTGVVILFALAQRSADSERLSESNQIVCLLNSKM